MIEFEKEDLHMHDLAHKSETSKFATITVKTQQEINQISDYLSKGRFLSMPIKTADEIEKLKISGGICAKILDEISSHVKPGVTINKLDAIIHELICVKYVSEVDRLLPDAKTNLSSRISACFGLNNIIANATPDNTKLKEGDLFGIDISIRKNGWCGDTRKSWLIGEEASPVARSLFAVSNYAMWLAISMVKPGESLEKIAGTVEKYAGKNGFSMINLPIAAGHSLGKMHMDGWIIPFHNKTGVNKGRILKKGMVFTVETFMSAGDGNADIQNNSVGSVVTRDNTLACYWEHAIAVTETGCEILDLRAEEKEIWKQLVRK